MCPHVHRKLRKAFFADFSRMPLVRDLRRVLAPFRDDFAGIDKPVFGNGVCGERPIVCVFLGLYGEEPLYRFSADELRCPLIKVECVALVYKTVFLRCQAIGLVGRRGIFLERGTVFAAADCSAAANEVVSNCIVQSLEVVREPQIVLVTEGHEIAFAKRYGLVEIFTIAQIFFVLEYMDSGILASIFVKDLGRRIGRGVIADYDFEILFGLSQNGIQLFPNKSLAVICRHCYRNHDINIYIWRG